MTFQSQGPLDCRMVPEQEFENLKQLALKIEAEAVETIDKKDNHIRSLLAEMDALKLDHKADLEEQRLQFELKVTDLEMKSKRQGERL